jgi:hypothetical protein
VNPTRFLVFSPMNDDTITGSMGQADYSYYFVMKSFLPLLRELGDVQMVADLDRLGEECRGSVEAGYDPLLMFFAPPHLVPESAPFPVIPVFAWEFDTIPNEEFGGDPRQNWQATLTECPGSITHSAYAVQATQRALGPDYPLVSMPAPVYDAFAELPDAEWTGEPRTLTLNGTVLDSHALGLTGEPDFSPMEFTTAQTHVTLSGVVFTGVLNPQDARKNWYDQLTAFVWAFRDNPDVTLVIKMVHYDRDRSCASLLQEMRKLAPYQCRIVVIHGYLEQDSFNDLVRATTYALNASHAEGQCLPLMEFMSAGKPAVSPDHTAMSDYINPADAFIVATTPEWAAWPQDPRLVLRCLRYRVDWGSLRQAFLAAWQVATDDDTRYRQMSAQARTMLREHCSLAVSRDRLRGFLASVGFEYPSASAST